MRLKPYLSVVVIRILTNDYHTDVFPLAMIECIEHILARRKDCTATALFTREEFLSVRNIMLSYQKILEVGFLGLLLDEFSPITTHTRMELTVPLCTSLHLIAAIMYIQGWFPSVSGTSEKMAAHPSFHSLPILPTVTFDWISCVNTAIYHALSQNILPPVFGFFAAFDDTLKKESNDFCTVRFMLYLKVNFQFLFPFVETNRSASDYSTNNSIWTSIFLRVT